jgi:predicted NBD/HSP70 family sugar kinase
VRKIDTRHFVRATRSTVRDINRQILLNLVRDHQPVSRADLARRMDIGRGMVTSLVDELLGEGAIYEGGTVDAPRGRRPQMLYVRTRDRLVVGVDVRFSRTAVMLADFAGRAIAQEAFDTVVDPDGLVAALATRVRRLLDAHSARRTCEGIGLVVPGMIDQRTGRVLNSPQLGWRDVEIRARLADATGFPVQIDNAPVACAQAQLWLGQRGGASVPRDFAYMTVSDGVGVGVVVGGQVLRGHGFTAGEFGHVPISLDGPTCLCGARGCLEAYTSNLATLSRYLGHELSPSRTRALLQESGLTIADVIARFRAGDARAAAAIAETARYLGAGIATVVNALNPAQIFVGGEITAAWDAVAPAVQAALAERALTAEAAATPIVAEPPEALPRLRGAAALVAAPMFAAPQVA